MHVRDGGPAPGAGHLVGLPKPALIDFSHVRSAEELALLAGHSAARLLDAERAVLYVLDEDREALVHQRSALALDGPGIGPWCAFHRQSALIAGQDGRRHPAVDGLSDSAVGVPVLCNGRPRGALVAYREARFAEADRDRLEDVAHSVASALVTLEVREDLSSLSICAQEWLVAAIELIAPGGDGHVWRVSQTARALAARIGFSAQDTHRIWTAARYHDLGWILGGGKPRWEVQRYHAMTGAQALRSVRLLSGVAPIVEMHHERYDGSGSPGGLFAGDVPLEAYVLAFAEDLDEAAAEGLAPAQFLEQRAEAHHPRVVAAYHELEVR